MPTFGKIERCGVPKDEPSMDYKLKIASVPCTLTRGHKAAWGGFQILNVTKSYLEKRRHQEKIQTWLSYDTFCMHTFHFK